jgi:Arc/MetJ-type ribon-helix-helix transcriptional regulator
LKTLQIELPEKLAQELEALVKEGWFRDEAEAIRYAILEFLNRHRLQLIEQFQMEDIAWALGEKEA